MEGYCINCHAKRQIKDAKTITMKNDGAGGSRCVRRIFFNSLQPQLTSALAVPTVTNSSF